MLLKFELFITALFFCLSVHAANVMTFKKQASMTPQQALHKLMVSNNKFVDNDEACHQDHSLILKNNAKGQHPFAFIFNCVDSRSVPEILFNQTLGNIFVGRVAGNVVDKNVLGSMEFATKIAGAKLIVIMGHTDCGAVKGACNGAQLGNLTHLLSQIKPAVDTVKASEKSSFNCKSSKTIDAIAKQNVLDQMRYVLNNSSVIRNLVDEHAIILVGAMHHIRTGKVNFFDIHGKTIKANE